jgi:hypothetical protein
MAELASLVLGVAAIASSAFSTLQLQQRLGPSAVSRSDQTEADTATLNSEWLLLTHDAAAARLQHLLTTDVVHRASQADLARIDNLCKSSLVLSSTIFVEIRQADWKQRPNRSLTQSLIKYAVDLTRHIENECEVLER